MPTRRNFSIALAAAPWMLSSSQVKAQSSRRQMTVVVGYAPGAGTDLLARVFANGLAAQIGESVVVENRLGAGGTIGASYVAGMPADGRTLLYTACNTLLSQEFLLKEVKFRTLQALMPLAKTCDVQAAIVTAASHPANSLSEFIAMATRSPRQHSFAHYGDLGLISMAAEAGVELIRVPYKGGAPGLVDVLSGRVDIIVSSQTTVLPMVKAGKLKLLAVMGEKRWPEYPNVSTVKEVLPNFKFTEFQGVLVPADTPKAVADPLLKLISAVISTPEYRRSLSEQGAIADPMGPDDFRRLLVAHRGNIQKIVEASGIQPE